jgi:hypothetical protein
MRKGTTPIFTFTLPFATVLVQKAKVIFEYDDEQQLCKVLTADNFKGETISVQLTQEETFKFSCNSHIKVQLRVLTVDGDALTSDVYTVFVEECLDNEVLK